jgi:hypothetical protein
MAGLKTWGPDGEGLRFDELREPEPVPRRGPRPRRDADADGFEARAGESARAVLDATGDPPHACAVLLRRAAVLLECDARLAGADPKAGRLSPRPEDGACRVPPSRLARELTIPKGTPPRRAPGRAELYRICTSAPKGAFRGVPGCLRFCLVS